MIVIVRGPLLLELRKCAGGKVEFRGRGLKRKTKERKATIARSEPREKEGIEIGVEKDRSAGRRARSSGWDFTCMGTNLSSANGRA